MQQQESKDWTGTIGCVLGLSVLAGILMPRTEMFGYSVFVLTTGVAALTLVAYIVFVVGPRDRARRNARVAELNRPRMENK